MTIPGITLFYLPTVPQFLKDERDLVDLLQTNGLNVSMNEICPEACASICSFSFFSILSSISITNRLFPDGKKISKMAVFPEKDTSLIHTPREPEIT